LIFPIRFNEFDFQTYQSKGTSVAMLQNATNLRKATAITVDDQQKVYTDKLSRHNANDLYSIPFKNRSSLDVAVDGTKANTTVDLIRDRSSKNPSPLNARPADQFSSWSATGDGARALTPISISPGGGSSSSGSSNSGNSGRWNASFINRTKRNVSDFRSYDFSRPNAVRDLGGNGARTGVAARLKADFGKGKPAAGVNKDNFAAEVWTRVDLKEGSFYQIRSASNDGTRFYFKNSRTGEVVKSFNGDWRNRSAKDKAWTQTIRVPQGGEYDFYVQYYERKGASVLDVSLEEMQMIGRVVSASGVNVRQQPSRSGATLGNGLDNNEQFRVLRQVNSTDGSGSWYEIQTNNGQRGFVSADTNLTQLSDRTRAVDLTGNGSGGSFGSGGSGGGGTFTPPITNNPIGNPPRNGGSSGNADGFIRGSQVALRNSPSTSSEIVKDLSGSTKVKVIGKESGSAYGSIYDQWYKVEAGGQTGYVAAYYVEVPSFNGKFSTALNSGGNHYRTDFNNAQQYKADVERATAKYSSWLKPSIVAAMGSRESAWGAALDSQGRGDQGFGHGLMQIDSAYHPEFIATGKWRNPIDNLNYALDNVLAPYYQYLSEKTNLRGFDLLRGAIAAYNTGPGGVERALREGKDVDAYTHGNDYSWDVINRAGWFQDNGWT
jgi:uncharacterized protein YgiM (DUF1202 family)